MERLKEQLKYETELLRLSWVTAIAIGGGNAGLLLGSITLVRAILLAIGFLLILGAVSFNVRQDHTIRQLLRELGEKQ